MDAGNSEPQDVSNFELAYIWRLDLIQKNPWTLHRETVLKTKLRSGLEKTDIHTLNLKKTEQQGYITYNRDIIEEIT